MVGGDVDEVDARDIVMHLTNGYFQHVYPLHNAYVPLRYVLLFQNGLNRWHDGIPLKSIDFNGMALGSSKMTKMQ
jgi:hypothetical protein